MADARMVATNTHRRWRAVQSAAPRADRMTCSSHGLALGLIKTRCLPIQSLTSPSCSKEAFSLPYHIGNGWFGGFLPATVFAIVAATGDIYSGLWYPIAVACMSLVIGLFFLPET